MATTLYYFSATGNSLTTARKLAKKLGDCKLVPVTAVKEQCKIIDRSETVGFVFPVYYGDMPYPVRELISKMVFAPNAYIFIFTTYRAAASDVANRVDLLLRTRGQRLSQAAGILMPANSAINEPEVDRRYLENQDASIAACIDVIVKRTISDYTEGGVLGLRPVNYPNNFRGLAANEDCIGCGLCVQVCPMKNITISDGRAIIGDNCATCLACFHWCPAAAISMTRDPNICRRPQYRHPDVTVEDIIAQQEL